MINSDVAIQYANALCQLAVESKKEDEIVKDSKELLEVLDEDKEFVTFYTSRNITKESKKDVIDKVFGKKINDYLVNLLLYLVDNNDEKNLPYILEKFNSTINEIDNKIEVKIYTPFAIDEKDVDAILNKIENKTLKKAYANVIIDTSLIGGIKVEYNDVVYNNSIKNKIDLIKNNIRKK